MTVRVYSFAPFPPVEGLEQRTLSRRARPRPAGESELLLTETLRPRYSFRRVAVLALAVLAAPLAAATTIPGLGEWLTGRGPDELEIALREPLPADLVAATRGEASARQIEGAAAQQINAALPFSSAPLESARPFRLDAVALPVASRALHCLTQAVYYEAAFEPVEGRRAVAQVVLNRVRHPAFPNSVCGVVYDGSSRRTGCQFSFTCDGSLRRAPSPGAWAEAERIAREALQGKVASTVGTATHYHANYVAPYWAPRLTKLSQIGAHIFYRWPGAWGRSAAFSSLYAGAEAIPAPRLTEDPDVALAEAVPALLPPDVTDRRAPQDVGGRLDVTKGWTLSIPSPSDTRGAYASALERQARAAAAAASSSNTSGIQ